MKFLEAESIESDADTPEAVIAESSNAGGSERQRRPIARDFPACGEATTREDLS